MKRATVAGPMLALTALGGAACQGSPDSSADPAGVLAHDAPAGFQLNSHASGRLALSAASRATPLASDDMEQDLRSAGFSDGYANIWTRDGDFVSAMAFQLGSTDRAEAFVSQQNTRLLDGKGTNLVADSQVPGAYLFLLFGSVSARNQQVFCQGEVFPVDRFAIEVDTCSPLPGSTAPARGEARRQYDHASRTLGVTAAVANPTPN